jgi:hypothetical protein
MSSATSTSRVRLHRRQAGDPNSDADRSSPEEAGFRPWHFFVLASLISATAGVIMSRQSTPEHLILISLTISAAGFAAAGFYRMLAPLAADDAGTVSGPLSDRLRTTLEREKALALRSIKELEFDRAMGKLSAADFEEMSGRLRSRALTLMKQLDQGDAGYRTVIERELSARLAHRGVAAAPAPAGARTDARCGRCGTANDADAAFCKRCGLRLA